MNISSRKLISGILAFVMMMSTVMVANVSVVSAAVNTYELCPSDGTNTDGYFTASTGTLSGNTLQGGTITKADGTNVTISSAVKMNSSGTVTFNVVGTAEVTVIWGARADKTSTCTMMLDSTVFAANSTQTGGPITEVITDVQAGSHTIKRSSGESGLYYVKVVDTVSDNASTYTISGTCNVTNTEFAVGDMTAVADGSGNWTISQTAESAPFGVGNTFAVSLPQYDCEPASITLAAGNDEYSFDGGNITFTKKELLALTDGIYGPAVISEGLPNFDLSNIGGSFIASNQIKLNNDTYIEFKVNDYATIEVEYGCGSSDAAKTASLSIRDTSNNILVDGTTLAGGDPVNTIMYENAAAGTYRLYSTASNTTATVNSVTITTVVGTEFGISGTVTNEQGSPIEGATVTPSVGTAVNTGADGTFTIGGLMAATYLTVSADGYITKITDPYSTDVTDLNIQLTTKIEAPVSVWDFGGVAESDAELYDNKITLAELQAVATPFSANVVFGDVTYIAGSNDRVYCTGNTHGVYSSTFADGYNGTGRLYANGSGGDSRRCLVIDNVSAGDKLTLYTGLSQSAGADTTLHCLYMGEDGTQDDILSGIAYENGDVKAEFVAKYSGQYKLYYEAVGKPHYIRLVKTPAVTVSGTVSGIVPDSYSINFKNMSTNEVTNVAVTGDTYSVNLTPGYKYTASISVAGYAFTADTKNVSLETISLDLFASGLTADFTSEEVVLANVTGTVNGFDESYGRLGDIAMVITPVDPTVDVPEVTFTNMTYSVTVVPEKEYTISFTGVNDYEVVAGGTINVLTDAANDVTVATKALYTVSGSTLDLDTEKAITAGTLTFTNDDGYAYSVEANASAYSIDLRAGEYTITGNITDGVYDTPVAHVSVKDSAVNKNIYFQDLSAECTYYLPELLSSGDNKGLGITGFRYNNDTSVAGNTGATIVVPVNGVQTVTVGGWHSGTVDINGQNEVTFNSSQGPTSCGTTSYTTDGIETSVTVNMVATGYLYYIKVSTPVDYSADIYVPNDYATISDALAAIAKMPRDNTEATRVTVHIAPGTYNEQLNVSVPYVTFVNDTPEQEVKITWYYGIGYKYYSLDSAGFYNKALAKDQYTKTPTVNYWGATVYIGGSAKGFQAEGIVFENSFNKYVSDIELTDGVEVAGTQDITFDRTEAGADVRLKGATERAAAVCNYATNVEFKNCKFTSSQDTLMTGNGDQTLYFVDCTIEGMTDYIFGQSNTVFERCNLVWCGYSDGSNSGYITAARVPSSGYGYLFKDCTVSGDTNYKYAAGYFGRPWGAGAKVIFMNTVLANGTNDINAVAWHEMSGVNPDQAAFAEYKSVDANGNAIDVSGRYSGVPQLTDDEAAAIDPGEYFLGWTPVYYEGVIIPPVDNGDKKWDLAGTAVCDVNLQGNTGEYNGLIIDATSGKFAAGSNGYTQTNATTIIQVPVKGDCDIYVSAYTGTGITFDGAEQISAGEGTPLVFEYRGAEGYATITVTTNGYFKYIETKHLTPVTDTKWITSNATATLQIQGTTAEFSGLLIDATSGKFFTRDNDTQVNANTIIKVPVNGNCDIYVDAYVGTGITFNGAETVSTGTGTPMVFKYRGEAGYATIAVTTGGYLNYIETKHVEVTEDYSVTWYGAQVRTNADGTRDVRLLGVLNTEDLVSIENVGFAVATTDKTAADMKQLTTTTVFSSISAGDMTYTATDMGGTYIVGAIVTGVPVEGGTLYVYTQSTVNGETTYSDPVEAVVIPATE